MSSKNKNIEMEEEDEVDNENVYIVEKILNFRIKPNGKREYYLKWKGYPE